MDSRDLLEYLLGLREAAGAAWVATKTEMRKVPISFSKDGKTGYNYYKTCGFAGVEPPPENKERWVDTRVPHPGKHMRKVFEDIKAHERKFAAKEAEYKHAMRLLDAAITLAEQLAEKEAQKADEVADAVHEEAERKLDPEGVAARDAADAEDDKAAEEFGWWVPACQDPDLLRLMEARDEDADTLEAAGYALLESGDWTDLPASI